MTKIETYSYKGKDIRITYDDGIITWITPSDEGHLKLTDIENTPNKDLVKIVLVASVLVRHHAERAVDNAKI